jgi:hypothetical protein
MGGMPFVSVLVILVWAVGANRARYSDELNF